LSDSGTFAFIGPRIFNLNELRPDMPGGLLFRFPTMQLRPSAGDLLRAFFEGVAYAVRANIAQIEAVSGRPTTRLFVGGGMSRRNLLMQLVADVSGLPLCRAHDPESTGLGCAILVASGAGVYSDSAVAVRAMCSHSDVAPSPERKAEIEPGYAKWCELYASLSTLSV
jgi:sugar (pentulose or hexulose) kinase